MAYTVACPQQYSFYSILDSHSFTILWYHCNIPSITFVFTKLLGMTRLARERHKSTLLSRRRTRGPQLFSRNGGTSAGLDARPKAPNNAIFGSVPGHSSASSLFSWASFSLEAQVASWPVGAGTAERDELSPRCNDLRRRQQHADEERILYQNREDCTGRENQDAWAGKQTSAFRNERLATNVGRCFQHRTWRETEEKRVNPSLPWREEFRNLVKHSAICSQILLS